MEAQLRELKRKLGDVSSIEKVRETATTISSVRNNLTSILGGSSDILISNETRSLLGDIISELGNGAGSTGRVVIDSITQLRIDLAAAATPRDRNDIRARIEAREGLLGIAAGAATTYAGSGLSRSRTIVNTIYGLSNRFDLGINLENQNYTGVAIPTFNLNRRAVGGTNYGFLVAGAASPNYSIMNSDMSRYSGGGKCKVKAKMIDGTEEEIEVGGLSISGGTNMQIDVLDLPADKEIDSFEVNIQARYPDGATGMNVVSDKKFTVDIGASAPLNTDALRRTEFDAFNGSGTGRVIEHRLNEDFHNKISQTQREAFFRALKHTDGPKFEQLGDDASKEAFYQDVRDRVRTMTVGLSLNDYNRLRSWFVDDRQEWNKKIQNIKNSMNYRNYINNNLEQKIQDYMNHKLDLCMIDNWNNNTELKARLTDFLRHREANKRDSDVHMDIDRDLGQGKRKIKKKYKPNRPSFFHKKDINYMRFFGTGDSVNFTNQQVDIYTNIRPEDVGNPEPVKYGMKMNMTNKSKIELEVNIEGEESILLNAGDPAALIKRVMRDQRIHHGKARAHMGYNVIRGMIQLAKKNDLSLDYRDGNLNHRIDIDSAGNLVQLTQEVNTGTWRQTTNKIFDYSLFKTYNDFDNSTHQNRALRQGIENTMTHFSSAMNQTHKQYRNATKRSAFGLVGSRNKMRFRNIFRDPFKRGARKDVRFSTSVTGKNGKTVSINFDRGIFEVNIDGLKKPIKTSDFGKVLNTRVGRERIFDGMERDMVDAVYKNMFDKMRNIPKIQRSNFGVRDRITGRLYTLDSDGSFGYMTPEQLRHDSNPIIGLRQRIFRPGNGRGPLRGIIRNNSMPAVINIGKEPKEIMKNPYIMSQLLKAMNQRLGLRGRIKSMFN